MVKTIAGGHRPIGPRLRLLGADEPLLPRPGPTALVDALFRLGHPSCHGSRGEDAAHDTGRFENGLLIGRELLELLLDEPPETLRDNPSDGLAFSLEAPAPIRILQQMLRHDLIDHR